ncbi:outer membrane beta-barrel protein [Telmatobacter bradus]|uniref:outer membrane beta-barrel protein n=1 Tax=Telmatobacter bradus TaxID=474953 RepID=UPI003B437DBF
MSRILTRSGRFVQLVPQLMVAFCLLGTGLLHAQTAIDGTNGEASLWAGAEYANFKAGFPVDSNVRLGGMGVFLNYNRTRHYAVEAHMRMLNQGSWYGETQQDWLIGPRYTFLRGEKLRPYAYFLVGMVHMQYPFEMGASNSFTMAPGGGVEYRLSRNLSVRGGYEFQSLATSSNFSNEPGYSLKPNGFTMGVAYRIFSKR